MNFYIKKLTFKRKKPKGRKKIKKNDKYEGIYLG